MRLTIFKCPSCFTMWLLDGTTWRDRGEKTEIRWEYCQRCGPPTVEPDDQSPNAERSPDDLATPAGQT